MKVKVQGKNESVVYEGMIFFHRTTPSSSTMFSLGHFATKEGEGGLEEAADKFIKQLVAEQEKGWRLTGATGSSDNFLCRAEFRRGKPDSCAVEVYWHERPVMLSVDSITIDITELTAA